MPSLDSPAPGRHDPRMSRYTYPLTVDTIGKMSEKDYLSVHCQNDARRHTGSIDLMAAVMKYGPDISLKAFHAAIFCRVCREAGRPDRNIRISSGHEGGLAGEHLGDVYDREMAKRSADNSDKAT